MGVLFYYTVVLDDGDLDLDEQIQDALQGLEEGADTHDASSHTGESQGQEQRLQKRQSQTALTTTTALRDGNYNYPPMSARHEPLVSEHGARAGPRRGYSRRADDPIRMISCVVIPDLRT